MKDYCTNNFQRKSFILNFEVLLEEKKIIINYADNTFEEKKLDLKTIKWILMQMRKQIINYKPQYETNKAKVKENKFQFIANIANIGFASTICALATSWVLLYSMVIYIPIIAINLLWLACSIKQSLESKFEIARLLPLIKDYEKNLFFIEHSAEFENSAISFERLHNSSPNIMKALNKGLTIDSLLKGNDISSISQNEISAYKDLSIDGKLEEAETLKEEGFKDISETQYPIFNESSIDMLSKEELEQYQAKNRNSKGAVLVKTMGMK